LVIDAAEDAGRVGDQGVAGRRPQVHAGQPLEHLVGDAVGGGQGQVEGGGVGDAGAVDVGRLPADLAGQPLDLPAGPVDQDDANPQAAQERDVEQEVGEVVVG